MSQAIMPVYSRPELELTHGKGVHLFDHNGDEYLDFYSGIAVNCLGHCHPKMVEALRRQSESLWHISNLFHIPGADHYASLLTSHSFAETIFFCNSGTEANECAIKMIRRFHHKQGNNARRNIITFSGAFHGRSLAAVWASKEDPKLQEGFDPAMPGFVRAEFNNLESVKATIDSTTAAIMIEPIQGDGGIRPADREFLQGLRQLCDEHGILLCFDEIQCGMGRTGKLFAHEWSGITPDILSSAKGIGGGFPFGACLATHHAASGMEGGTHGSTYGGNPLAIAVGTAVLEELIKPELLNNVVTLGNQLAKGLNDIANDYPNIIKQVRGYGLIQGIQCEIAAGQMVEKLRDHHLLAAPASENVVRLMPPLVANAEHIDHALKVIRNVCKEL